MLKEFFNKLFNKGAKDLERRTGLKTYNEEYEKWLGV